MAAAGFTKTRPKGRA